MPWDIPHLVSDRRQGMKPYYKAIAGFLAGAVVAFLGAQDGGVTGAEWLQILLAGLGASGLVYVAPKNRERSKTRHVDRGAVSLVVVLIVVVLVLLILWLLGGLG